MRRESEDEMGEETKKRATVAFRSEGHRDHCALVGLSVIEALALDMDNDSPADAVAAISELRVSRADVREELSAAVARIAELERALDPDALAAFVAWRHDLALAEEGARRAEGELRAANVALANAQSDAVVMRSQRDEVIAALDKRDEAARELGTLAAEALECLMRADKSLRIHAEARPYSGFLANIGEDMGGALAKLHLIAKAQP